MDIIVNTMLLAQSTPTDQQQVGIYFFNHFICSPND